MLAAVEIRFDVDATVDGTAFARGATTRKKPGQIRLEVHGTTRYVSLHDACTVRDTPELDCYP